MRKAFLIASTPLQTIEMALEKVAKRCKKFGKVIRYDILLGKSFQFSKTYRADFVILLGPNAFKINQDVINQKAIGLIMGDPMNLDCVVSGEDVIPLDFTAKKDGHGYYLRQLDVGKVAKLLYKAYISKKSTHVDVKGFDAIPTIIGAIQDRTSFVEDLAALTYTIRNKLDREKFKRVFVTWVTTDDSVDDLKKALVGCASIKETSKRITAIMNIFDGAKGINIRNAIKTTLKATRKSSAFDYEGIAKKHGISAFDLRYIANLARKDPIIIDDMDTAIIHYKIAKSRYVEDDFEKENDNGIETTAL